MRVLESDLTAAARIRNAALERFARDGLAATSIRDVAEAAGVSAGLVQHHFSTRRGLRDAVNDYVASVVGDAFSDTDSSQGGDPIAELGDRITSVVREHPTAILYVARALAEGDDAVLRLFDAFYEIAASEQARLRRAGLLRSDVDRVWAALQPLVWNLGCVLFSDAISRRLPESFFSPGGLERWNAASTAFFAHGVGAGGQNKR